MATVSCPYAFNRWARGGVRWCVTISMDDNEETLDVAVVGGGVSGLYAAWRVLSCPRGASPVLDELAGFRAGAPRVAVFEMSQRIGGRLLTLRPPGAEPVCMDMGALRYRASHDLVVRLVEQELGLPVAAHIVGPDNVVYPRIDRYPGDGTASTASGREPRGHEPAPASPVDEMRAAIETVIGRDPVGLSPAEWLEIRKRGAWAGRRLSDWGLWDLLREVMTAEGYDAVTGVSGYAAVMGDWNAADALAWFGGDLASGTDYRRPTGGMQSIAHGLSGRIASAGGGVFCGRELTGLKVTEAGLVELRFADGPTSSGDAFGASTRRYARHVVLAMPPRSLERLVDRGRAEILSDPAVGRLIGSVRPVAMFNVCCCYRKAWWREQAASPASRRGSSDLPLGQVMSFALNDHADMPGGSALSLVVAYNDERTIQHWSELVSSADRSAAARSHHRWSDYEAPTAMAAEIHRLLRFAYGIDPSVVEPEPPFSTIYRDWTADPFGGGCHAWRVHRQSWVVTEKIVQPVPNAPIYVCGEAYSMQQGWVQGALEHVELLLQRAFDVPP
ncbi:MAG: hypothetical protein QOG44_460 [Acidimicrobiaceae bacterium]|nr:hypothetical protein [Acidimicrobiaceae bacterium]